MQTYMYTHWTYLNIIKNEDKNLVQYLLTDVNEKFWGCVESWKNRPFVNVVPSVCLSLPSQDSVLLKRKQQQQQPGLSKG